MRSISLVTFKRPDGTSASRTWQRQLYCQCFVICGSPENKHSWTSGFGKFIQKPSQTHQFFTFTLNSPFTNRPAAVLPSLEFQSNQYESEPCSGRTWWLSDAISWFSTGSCSCIQKKIQPDRLKLVLHSDGTQNKVLNKNMQFYSEWLQSPWETNMNLNSMSLCLIFHMNHAPGHAAEKPIGQTPEDRHARFLFVFFNG